MVRHEAAEALGAIADPECLQLLTDFCQDPDAIVADSCVVRALLVLRFCYVLAALAAVNQVQGLCSGMFATDCNKHFPHRMKQDLQFSLIKYHMFKCVVAWLQVALDMLEYEQSGEFQYADSGLVATA